MYLSLEALVVDCTPLFEFLYWIWSRHCSSHVERDYDSGAYAFF